MLLTISGRGKLDLNLFAHVKFQASEGMCLFVVPESELDTLSDLIHEVFVIDLPYPEKPCPKAKIGVELIGKFAILASAIFHTYIYPDVEYFLLTDLQVFHDLISGDGPVIFYMLWCCLHECCIEID
jgi:hypothetical protein